jgi:hypothetical protein
VFEGLAVAAMPILLSSAVLLEVWFSFLRSLCVILSCRRSTNVGGCTRISFGVRVHELELLVKGVLFFNCWQPSLYLFELFAYGT